MERIVQVANVGEAERAARRVKMTTASAKTAGHISDLRSADALGGALSRATSSETMTAAELTRAVDAGDR